MLNMVLGERFRIEDKIAISPQSEVYKGRDLKTNEAIALKLIRPRLLATEQFGARLKQEFQVLRELQHPNIVRVIDIGETNEHMVYFAMEYVPGPTLESIVEKQGPLPPAKVAEFLDQVAPAFDLAHSHRVIHRDINPSNFLVAKDASGKEVYKIFDFGLAKVLDAEPENQLVQTGAAQVRGDAAYMSPEQAMGKQVTEATDIYSLGVTLFRLLTGTLPFEGKHFMDLIIGHAKKPVPTFAERNPNIKIPEAVEAVVRQALAKKPSDRPGSASDLAGMFRAAVAGAAIPRPKFTKPTASSLGGEPLVYRRSARTTTANRTQNRSDSVMTFAIVALGVFIVIVLVFVFWR